MGAYFPTTPAEREIIKQGALAGLKDSQLGALIGISSQSFNRRLGRVKGYEHLEEPELIQVIESARAELAAKIIGKLTQIGLEQENVEALKWVGERICGFTKTVETRLDADVKVGYEPTFKLVFQGTEGDQVCLNEFNEWKKSQSAKVIEHSPA